MKPIVTIVAAILIAALGFGGGYWYRATHPTPQAELEDYAVANTLGVLGFVHYLDKGQTDNMRELLNVNLNDHLARINRYQGENNSNEFIEAKIRTLNAVAILWKERPPFKSKQWQLNDTNASWYPEWQEITKKNFELLSWAQQQCSQNPSIKCKSPNKPSELTR